MGMTLAVFSSSGKTPWLREELIVSLSICARLVLKDQYGPRVFFLEFPFSAENIIIRSILNLW